MNFEALGRFDWYNDPENVRFETDGMVVYAKEGTDFWQSVHRLLKKDNGHFFYCWQEGNFSLVLKWHFDGCENLSQCGIMLRIDELNWLKAAIMNEENGNDVLGSSLTVNGHSDWAGVNLGQKVHDIWFKLNRIDDDYILFYSLDGKDFIKLRIFYLLSCGAVRAGAYIASPQKAGFGAVLTEIKAENL